MSKTPDIKRLLAVLLLCAPFLLHAQRIVNVDKGGDFENEGLFYMVGGEPVVLSRYIKVVEGSAFFSDTWLPGALKLNSGSIYDSALLKLDLLANEVHFQDKAGQAFIATSPIAEIWLTDVTGESHHFYNAFAISSTIKKGWYKLISDGNLRLLQHDEKQLSEIAGYNTGLKNHKIVTYSTYLVWQDSLVLPVKKIGTIAEKLTHKQGELEAYIKKNKLGSKNAADFIALVAYYNSLPE